jgi:hypothetical protein
VDAGRPHRRAARKVADGVNRSGTLTETAVAGRQPAELKFGPTYLSVQGAGMNFGFGDEGCGVYIEARYHYIWGPEYTNPTTGVKQSATGTFFPITFGFRF